MKTTILLLFSVTVLVACAKIQTVEKIVVTINGATTTFGEAKVPEKSVEIYKKAVVDVITTISSNVFETQLDSVITSLDSETHKSVWKSLSAKQIVEQLKMQLNGTSVETLGGIKGFWDYQFNNTSAYDTRKGKHAGPILINRSSLIHENWSSIDMANSIAHEVTHRIGLEHPTKSPLEPPYCIGNLVEKILTAQVSLK